MSDTILDENKIDELLSGPDTDVMLSDDIDVDAILGTSDEAITAEETKNSEVYILFLSCYF